MIAALRVTPEQYLDEMDIDAVEALFDAKVISGEITKRHCEWIWEKKRKPFEVW